MSARLAEERRRKRRRREARERAWREWVCGGPLVAHDEPVIGGRTDAEAAWNLQCELERRGRLMHVEAVKLARAFAADCCARLTVREGMFRDLAALWDSLPNLTVIPAHSTAKGVTTAPTIPRL